MTAVIVTLMLGGVMAAPAVAALSLPVVWSVGGLDAGSTGAGQAARMTVDAAGNVAVVSGPSGGRDLAVTSYTSSGALRWRRTISPSSGTFAGDWVVAAPNGDFVAVGHNRDSHGRTISSSVVRYGSDGTFQWRADLIAQVARLVVDAQGNAYVAFGALGSIQVYKYSAAGALVWAKGAPTGAGSYVVATSMALSPDGADVVLSGDLIGGATWITAAFDSVTGTSKWLVMAAEGIAARDVVVDATRVYVAGMGNVGIRFFLTVVAYDRATGARLWRTDKKPADAGDAAGLRIAFAPDGSLVVTGQASRGFLDWYTVAFNTNGTVRWEAVRDGGLNTDEIPTDVLVLADGTTVVTGPGGPNLPGGYIQGVTAGYSANGTLLWEAFAKMATTWAAVLPNGNVCATGGYDALITCWQTPRASLAVTSVTPSARGQGATNPSETINGTGFRTGATVAFSGSGITVLSTTVTSSTSLAVKLSIAATAALGVRNVTVTNTDGSAATCTGCFTVLPGPTIAAVSPSAAPRGSVAQALTVTGTHFKVGVNAKFSGTGVTAGSVVRISATQLTVTIAVAATATIGPRTLTVINPDAGRAVMASAITIT